MHFIFFFLLWFIFSGTLYILAQKYFALEMQFWENTFFLFKQTPKKSLIKMFVAAISRLSHDTLYANDPHFHTG